MSGTVKHHILYFLEVSVPNSSSVKFEVKGHVMRQILLIYQEECDQSLVQRLSGCFLVLDDAEEKLKEISKDQNSATMELTTDMTLLWSDEDEDEDVTVQTLSPHWKTRKHSKQDFSPTFGLQHI